MSASVLLIVLFGAFLHAVWNAVVKADGDKLATIVMVNAAGAGIAAAVLPFLPQPAPESWPFLAASMVAQVVYFSLVAAAYRVGDMSQVYPLMRGTAPLLVAVASGPLMGETLSLPAWAGIVLVCGGVLGMALESGRRTGGNPAAVRFALVNALAIASYTLIDGIGVRLSGAPAAYTLWLAIITALPLLAWMRLRHPGRLWRGTRGRWHLGLLGGAGTLGSYGLALWAMTMAPVAVVAVLRESSILFATAISALVLKERIGPARLAATALIAAGAAVIRLA
ncbi:EamA family transporter [Azospirillum sp. RWY-5-1]|uniref:EamA family transporter n=1 Tax=Azospirillum oleiclasticum TaxID=2735135 RepID=A0ABX2TC42_9PROT|nr:EamA family transporter [Azospirillum oleiclasticum]NYZ13438.1 EamA family transporter [Azospirillum oleiclasticum]NYZ20599.1 EamA family transporter [Azospirillum oleiclasticum]